MAGRIETQRAEQRLAYAILSAIKTQQGLFGARYDGDFIVGTIEAWMEREEAASGVSWVLTANGLRKLVKKR